VFRACLSASLWKQAAKAATLDAGGVGACPHISFWFFFFVGLARFMWWAWLAFDRYTNITAVNAVGSGYWLYTRVRVCV